MIPRFKPTPYRRVYRSDKLENLRLKLRDADERTSFTPGELDLLRTSFVYAHKEFRVN